MISLMVLRFSTTARDFSAVGDAETLEARLSAARKTLVNFILMGFGVWILEEVYKIKGWRGEIYGP